MCLLSTLFLYYVHYERVDPLSMSLTDFANYTSGYVGESNDLCPECVIQVVVKVGHRVGYPYDPGLKGGRIC